MKTNFARIIIASLAILCCLNVGLIDVAAKTDNTIIKSMGFNPNEINSHIPSLEIVGDPIYPNEKALSLPAVHKGTRFSYGIASGDNTYQIQHNHVYTVSFDIYNYCVVDNGINTGIQQIQLYRGAKNSGLGFGSKVGIKSTILELDLADNWQSFEITFTADLSSNGDYSYLLFTIYHDSNSVVSEILVKNLSVTKNGPSTNCSMVREGSIRGESGSGASYVSAGVRYKGRLSKEMHDSATEVGFVVAPTELLNGMTLPEYVVSDGNTAIRAKVKADGMEDIIYAVNTDENNRTYYDYQLMLKGLTRENATVDMLDTEFSVAMYAVIDGETVYTETMAYSYNYILEKMSAQ
ncbi:MAG: hypothetical protein J6Q76_00755 [Clostridia bacterium]|nr:hypothetical protein [Clostridia bacterium]